jgi:AcrR family transcriptional regulator
VTADLLPRRAWGSLTRSDIVASAVDLARREGLEALTIRRLAAEMGAGRMSLYRHVPDKNALLDLVANEIAERSVIPPEALTGPWQERLLHLAHGMRDQLTTYPGFAELIMVRSNHGPGGLRIAETILEILDLAGLTADDSARFYLMFVDIVLGRAHRETYGDPTSPRRNADLFKAAAQSDQAPRLRELTPRLREVATDQVFDDELDMIIQAIEARAAKPKARR